MCVYGGFDLLVVNLCSTGRFSQSCWWGGASVNRVCVRKSVLCCFSTPLSLLRSSNLAFVTRKSSCLKSASWLQLLLAASSSPSPHHHGNYLHTYKKCVSQFKILFLMSPKAVAELFTVVVRVVGVTSFYSVQCNRPPNRSHVLCHIHVSEHCYRLMLRLLPSSHLHPRAKWQKCSLSWCKMENV